MTDDDLLKEWGVVCRKTITWHPTPDTTRTVTSKPHKQPWEARNDAWLMAEDAGYTTPRWWQWWRWGERNGP
jgi:hypothetical protein